MTQPDSNGNTFSLPSPREIDPVLCKILRALGRDIPSLDWLLAKYPHLSDPRPTNSTVQTNTPPNVDQSVSDMTNGAPSMKVDMPNNSTGRQATAKGDGPQRRV